MLPTQTAPPKFVEATWTQHPWEMSPEYDFLSGSCMFCTIVGRSHSLEGYKKRVFFDNSPGWHFHGPKNLEKVPPLSDLINSQWPPCTFIIKLFIENVQHLSHHSKAQPWLFACMLDHHSPTKGWNRQWTCWLHSHLPSTSLVASALLRILRSVFLSFYVQNAFLRVTGNFVFLGIERADSSSSSSERRHGPVLWVRGYSCVTGSSWETLATHLAWKKGVEEHLPGEVPTGTALAKRKEAV